MKDYFDIWMLSQNFTFEGRVLGEAIEFARNASEATPELAMIVTILRNILMPVVSSITHARPEESLILFPAGVALVLAPWPHGVLRQIGLGRRRHFSVTPTNRNRFYQFDILRVISRSVHTGSTGPIT